MTKTKLMNVRAAGAMVLAMALGAGCGGGGAGADPADPATASVQTTGGPAAAGSTVATTASGTAAAATAATVDPAMANATTTTATTATSTAATSAAAPASTAAATIVPLYTPPTDPSWNAVIAAKQAHQKVGVYAVVNPANGPGASYSVDYAQGIARLKAAGVVVLGYVSTDYTRRSVAAVEADISTWKSFYPGDLGGIFFDEQSNRAGDEPHYQTLVKYARDNGMPFTVGNPGADTSESFVGVFDVMLIYESGGVPPASRLGGWHAKYPATNFGIIPYATNLDPAYVKMARGNVKYIYLQNDTLPNPWDSVPPYFGDLLAALE
jgi:hypothetical protein